MSNKDYYYIYDVNLSRYLSENGIRYILKARSIKDGRIFTMYDKTDKLLNLTKTWK